MNKILTFSIAVLSCCVARAQSTSAGNSYQLDYNAWSNGGQPSTYINCGTSNSLNTGLELTMEVWIRAHNSVWNQKILGKMTNQLNNGYVLGIQSGGNYTELWDPAHYVTNLGTSPVDSAWIHLCTTFQAGGNMVSYINGNIVQTVLISSSSGITSSTAPFIIGLAPWDLYSFQTFGQLDEIRIWNYARTQSEIQSQMFKHLQGSEPGLVAYYDFNQSTGSSLPDLTSNGNNGTVTPAVSSVWSWVPSYAAVAGDAMYNMTDVNAVWFGKDPAQYNYAVTTSGLNLIANIQPSSYNYAVYGNNDSTGISLQNLPAGLPSGFQRMNREWLFNTGGNLASDLYFNLTTAAGGGTALAATYPAANYTLLVRDSLTQNYTPLYGANATLSSGNIIKFIGVPLQNKYYTLGVGSTAVVNPNSIQNPEWAANIGVFPNPASDELNLIHVNGFTLTLYDAVGNAIQTIKANQDNFVLPVKDLAQGMYWLELKNNNIQTYKKIIVSH